MRLLNFTLNLLKHSIRRIILQRYEKKLQLWLINCKCGVNPTLQIRQYLKTNNSLTRLVNDDVLLIKHLFLQKKQLKNILFTILSFTYVFNSFAQNNIFNSPYYRGTQNGISIFHWTTSNGLPQSTIKFLLQTENKLIWFVTDYGPVNFDGKKFQLLNLTYRKRLLSSQIKDFNFNKNNIAWISDKEIVQSDGKKINYAYRLSKKMFPILGLQFENSSIVLNTKNKLYNINSLTFSSVQNPSKKNNPIWDYKNNHYTASTVIKKDTLKIHYYSNKPETEHLVIQKIKEIKRVVIQQNKKNIRSVWQNNSSTIIITKDSLSIIRGRNLRTISLKNVLYSDEIISCLEDHVGNIWLGSSSFGLILLRETPIEKLRNIQNIVITKSKFCFVTSDNKIYFNSDEKTIVEYDSILGTKTIPLDFTVKTSYPFDRNRLLILGQDGNLHTYLKKEQRTEDFTLVPPPVTYLKPIAENLFFTSTPTHFILFNRNRIIRKSKIRPFNSIQEVKDALLIRNHIYILTNKGLIKTDKAFKKKEFIRVQEYNRLNFQTITSLGGNLLLIGTNGDGPLLYSLKSRKILKSNRSNANLNFIRSTYIDTNKQIWIATNSGIVQTKLNPFIHYFDKNALDITTNIYRNESGILNVEFNQYAPSKLKNGTVIFSSLSGPVLLKTKSNESFNRLLSNIIIENITIDNQKKSIDLSQIKKLVIKENESARIYFTMPTFSPERANQFEYKLIGNSQNWTSVNTSVILSNLTPGNYTLVIRTVSGSRKITLPIEVKSIHPYKAFYFSLIIVFLTLLIVYATYRITKNYQERKNYIAKLKQELKLLESEALRSQMNPHFIFNCLNTIQYLFLSNNKEKANRYLIDFSKLMRQTIVLLRNQFSNLEEELNISKLYLELEQLQFDDGFELIIDNSVQTPLNLIKVPSLILQIFLENAIVHGLKNHTNEKPVLSIIIFEDDADVIVLIGDNGNGFLKKKNTKHESKGIKIVTDRIKHINELYSWNIRLEFSESRFNIENIRTEVTLRFCKTHTITEK